MKNPVEKNTDYRFGNFYEGWNWEPSKLEAISFQNSGNEDMWIKGFGLYEITNFPEQQGLEFILKVHQGGSLDGDLIY